MTFLLPLLALVLLLILFAAHSLQYISKVAPTYCVAAACAGAIILALFLLLTIIHESIDGDHNFIEILFIIALMLFAVFVVLGILVSVASLVGSVLMIIFRILCGGIFLLATGVAALSNKTLTWTLTKLEQHLDRKLEHMEA